MLDYPTCLKLKENGFPQDLKKGDWYHFTKRKGQWLVDSELRADSLKGMTLKIPSLEELIEECGHVTLWKKNDKWHATGEKGLELLVEYNMVNWQMDVRDVEELNDRIFDGQTPIQAVANLWLALAKSN